MSENQKDASNEVAPDQVAPPMPTTDSAGSTGESSAVAVDLSPILARLDAIESSIPEEVDRRFKSGQDRNVYRIEKEIEDIRSIVTQAGGDFSKVETDLRIGELTRQVEELSGGKQEPVAPGRANLSPEWVAAQADTEIILKEAGIAMNDPDYVAFSARYAGKVNAHDWKGLVQSWVDKGKKQRQSQPGAAFSESSTPAADATPDELKTAYNEELAKIPRGRVTDVHNLKMKYRRQGLDI